MGHLEHGTFQAVQFGSLLCAQEQSYLPSPLITHISNSFITPHPRLKLIRNPIVKVVLAQKRTSKLLTSETHANATYSEVTTS